MRKYDYPSKGPLTPSQIAAMSDEEIEAANRIRPPSDRLRRTPLCGAKLRRNDPEDPAMCSRPAGHGTSHPGFGRCTKHGGNTRAGIVFAARAMGRDLIMQQKDRFGGDRTLPINNVAAEEALLEEVRRSVAMVRWLEDRIASWNPGSDNVDDSGPHGLPALVAETSKGNPGMTNEQAWLGLYREERAHMVKTANLAIQAGISERLVRIAEQQGEMLTQVIRAVLAALNLSSDQAHLVPQVVPPIIRAVAAGQPVPDISSLLTRVSLPSSSDSSS